MTEYLIFAILGLGAGALYAALAQGLILAYRGSGVINFAHGSIAMYVAYTYAELSAAGRLVLLPLPNPLSLIEGLLGLVGIAVELPDIPTFIDFGRPLPVWLAFAGALLVAALLGLLIHLLVFRPLRNAPILAKVVASVGLMLALQAVVTLRFGSDSRSSPSLLPRDVITILGERVAVNRIILALVALVIAIALAAVYRYTRFGWATEAAAESEKGAILAGLSVDRLAAACWVLASVTAGVVGILFSSITTLTPTNFSLFVLPALAAAMVARFTSFTLAAVVGLAIGAVQQVTTVLQGDVSFLPDFGLTDAVPVLVIIAVMVIRGQTIPTRGADVTAEFPEAPEPQRLYSTTAIVTGLAVLAALVLPFAYRSALINTSVGIVLALSMVVIVGYLGQISLMQMALAGMAALAMTRIAGDWGIPFPFAPILAAIVATGLGLLAAIPALRVRGVQLAIVTLGAAVAFEAMVLRNPSLLRHSDATGSIPSPSVGGLTFGVNDGFPIGRSGIPNPGFAIFTVVAAALCAVAVGHLRRNPTGRVFLAVRSNERAASVAGLDVRRTKLIGFAISAALAGVAGAVGAYRFEGVGPDAYSPFASLTILAIAYLGGISSLSGAVVAGALISGGVIPQITEDVFHVPQYTLLLSGIGLVLTAILNQRGIAGQLTTDLKKLRGRLLQGRHPREERRFEVEPA